MDTKPIAHSPKGKTRDNSSRDNPPEYSPQDDLRRIQQAMEAYNIKGHTKDDLLLLSHVDTIIICDDSGSMKESSEVPGLNGTTTRWEELKSRVKKIADLASALSNRGVSIHFLNKSDLDISNLTSTRDERFENAFNRVPNGPTPLTETIERAIESHSKSSSRHANVIVLTDGRPTGIDRFSGLRKFEGLSKAMRRHKDKESTSFSFVLCTRDAEIIKDFDENLEQTKLAGINEDYHWEKKEVIEAAKENYSKLNPVRLITGQVAGKNFTEGAWIVKCLLSGLSARQHDLNQTPAQIEAGRARNRAYEHTMKPQEPSSSRATTSRTQGRNRYEVAADRKMPSGSRTTTQHNMRH